MNLLLAGLQLFVFAPLVGGGRSLDVSLWPGDLLFRADALNVAFGVAWTLTLALGLPVFAGPHNPVSMKQAGLFGLTSIGLLVMAYARQPLLFLLGWEVVGLSLWLLLQSVGWPGNLRRAAVAIHLPGLLLLLVIFIDPLGPFAPPQGGAAVAWSLLATLTMGAVVLVRCGYWFVTGWQQSFPSQALFCVCLDMLAAPFLLAKALVAAPWSDLGAWSLALMGAAALLGVLFASLTRSVDAALLVASSAVASALLGFGLAPLSPLAALGATAFLLVGALWLTMATLPYRGALFFAQGLLCAWLVSQGALDARYRMVAALLLPVVAFIAFRVADRPMGDNGTGLFGSVRVIPITCGLILLVGLVIFPQAAVEWVLRPVVSALAGGVGVPSTLQTNWGVGLLVRSQQENVLAALPATGIALALFLTCVLLYWLRGLARLITPTPAISRNTDNDTIALETHAE
ncbi:MAG: hypothetical protein ABI670_09850 [Chloroflexota bacterium]